MKLVFSILILYVPFPIFWSLFDQQGSRWTFQVMIVNKILSDIKCNTFQASHMNDNVFGTTIVPDQIQILNPAVVFLLIPIFNNVLYPWMGKHNIVRSMIHRMTLGGMIAGLAFFAAGILEINLERTYTQFPNVNYSLLNIINTLPCDVKINLNSCNSKIISGGIFTLQNIDCTRFAIYTLDMTASMQCKYMYLESNKFSLEMKCLEFRVSVNFL